MFKKRLLSALLVSSIAAASCTAFAAGPTFSDVTQESLSWAYEAIEDFAARGVVNGDGNGVFNPKGPVTREQFAKMLLLAYDIDPLENVTTSFADVEANRWSAGYIEAVKEYLPGYTENNVQNFKPKDAATREEIAAALVRMLKVDVSADDGSYAKEKFPDFDSISLEMRPYVSAASKKGLIEGYEDGTFRPHTSINRAQAVVMLSRALKQETPEDEKPSTDPERSDLKLDAVAETVNTNKITISGTVAGTDTKITVADQSVAVDDGKFSAEVELKEGANTIVVAADFADGTKQEEKVEVIYDPDAADAPSTEPDKLDFNIEADEIPEKVDTASLKVTGTVTGTDIKVTVDGKDAEVKDGKFSAEVTLKEGENTIALTAANKDGKTIEKTIKVTCTAKSAGDVKEVGDFYAYVLEDAYTTSKDNVKFSTFKAWNGEEEVTVNIEGTSALSIKKGTVIEYTLMSDDSIKSVSEVKGNAGAMTGASTNEDTVVIGGEEYKLDDDCAIIFVDTKDSSGEPKNTLPKAKDDNTNNVWYALSGGDIICLVVDANNEWCS